MIKIIFTLVVILSLNAIIYSQESNTLENKMNNYTQKVKMKWEFNPLKNYETDRYFSGWLDPDAYSSRFWLGDIFNIEQMYNNNFNFDKMDFYYQPTLATELTPIAFKYNEVHRFKIGVGYLTHFFLSKYKKGYDQYYGQSLMYGTYMQVEVFFDYIFNNTFKLRFSPLRHICAHISGDILGDEKLYNREKEDFKDSGFEQMHISAYYKYGWFTFYGGMNFAITGFDKSNIVNLFTTFAGTDFRVPIWGEISFITGIYFGVNYDLINNISRYANGERYHINKRYTEWIPEISVGIGFEIYRIIIGLKYNYARSKQLYSYKTMENKIGLDISIYL
ncbi:hypothetical protein [Brachyspira murdochii]|uniref:Outer membrane protein n=1 Tax=Brachyspira murdochii TaxID=84378 RepID=A0ABX5B383_9SPIR|nr:hypothetical protein [Brachyspira murdochii]PPS21736.1 hypothetical protein DJ52_09040 [Brachyspira murdochii]